ncbi:thermonuclease family protein [uncultured Winogradskyella sp.]|uniref:thermonuclease family protein n=1 Tax=uncultured Winogradskyella sp. TaxID=395353 RepID=UPI002604F8A1|nr:thermonuclease family protein [uncultured Winogradskyella sp.]
MHKYWLVFLFLIILSFSNNSKSIKKETIVGKVVAITDGDTFKLLTKDSTLIKVRLANIDCPERKQPFSNNAKQFVSKAIFSKTVKLNVLKKDRYRRYISNVIYDDSLSLCHELLKNGFAWHYRKYSKDSILQALEDNARENKLGLWQDKNAIAPWEWRDRKKKKPKE